MHHLDFLIFALRVVLKHRPYACLQDPYEMVCFDTNNYKYGRYSEIILVACSILRATNVYWWNLGTCRCG
jgi:hypothetical protein